MLLFGNLNLSHQKSNRISVELLSESEIINERPCQQKKKKKKTRAKSDTKKGFPFSWLISDANEDLFNGSNEIESMAILVASLNIPIGSIY